MPYDSNASIVKVVYSKSNRILYLTRAKVPYKFKNVLTMIKKYNIINECYKKAEHFINLASNSLSVFEDSKEKKILKNLTSFSLARNF